MEPVHEVLEPLKQLLRYENFCNSCTKGWLCTQCSKFSQNSCHFSTFPSKVFSSIFGNFTALEGGFSHLFRISEVPILAIFWFICLMMLLNLIDCSSYISNLVILSVRGSLVFFCHISTVVVFPLVF